MKNRYVVYASFWDMRPTYYWDTLEEALFCFSFFRDCGAYEILITDELELCPVRFWDIDNGDMIQYVF